MFDWHAQARATAAGADSTSKLLVAAPRQASGSNGYLSRDVSGQGETESGCDGGSPLRGASRGHRNEPFFIGVAGGTASGKAAPVPSRVHRNAGVPLGFPCKLLHGSWLTCRQDHGV